MSNIREINKIPALTWTWLKMNGAKVEMEKGADFDTFDKLSDLKLNQQVEITSQNGEKKTEVLHFDFGDKKSYLNEQTIIAEENSEITVIMDYSSEKNAEGFSEIKTKLIAKPYSKIHLVKVQLLGQNYTQIDDTECVTEENAFIDITQIELGGSKIYAQVKNDLKGYKAKFNSDTAYIAKNNQVFDMNYVVNHFGQKTDTKMVVKGVVDGNALKTYRGTIDFKNGCAGSTGDEQEETLLMSQKAINKSIPMILCDEEDVSGTHGATLGRLSAEELFYMQSRGISEAEAKVMMARAKIVSVANLIPNEEIVGKVLGFLEIGE